QWQCLNIGLDCILIVKFVAQRLRLLLRKPVTVILARTPDSARRGFARWRPHSPEDIADVDRWSMLRKTGELPLGGLLE
ncbi:hypothetical protein, partial [Klebsiella pneumoniae]|uniref:hypothetical protein n=1 Tax=Klebsiella pneumoniae TaxID=573 RepID=UPI001A95458C